MESYDDEEFKKNYHERKEIPGYRLMTVLLKSKDIRISSTICRKYMNCDLKLFSVPLKYRSDYHKGTEHKVFTNLLKCQFTVDYPDKTCCVDFTCIPLLDWNIRKSGR